MQYELSTEVIKILDDLAKRFGVAIDWADKNIMPYLMELYSRFINYKIVENFIPIILFVIFMIITIVFLKNYFKYNALAKETGESNWVIHVTKYNYIKDSYDMTELYFAITLVLGIIDLLVTILTCFAVDNLLKLIFVPELYMIDYLSTYMQ